RNVISRWRGWWDCLHDEQADTIDRIPPHWLRLAVFTASALTLYSEMVLVRWHASCFHAFAIFKNVSLLSCFLGLGIGYGLSGRLMERLPRVQGYSLNVLASLTGIGLFFLLSLAWTGPAVWMGVAALALAPFLIGHRRAAAVGIASMALVLLALGLVGRRHE